jgi:LPXTG-motif cell wall-anchored protein
MRNTTSDRRRAATGLAAMTAGAALLVVGIAGPASAHGDQEPEKPEAPVDLTCLEVADHYEIDQDWTEFKISELPEEEVKTDYQVGETGTVSIKITDNGAILEWWSTFGIDAVYVNGTDATKGSYFYLYEQGEQGEATHDYHLGVPPWGESHKNKIKSVSFCYDGEEVPPTTSSSTTTSSIPEETTSTTVEATTSTTVVEDTTTTTEAAAPTTSPSTTPPTTESPGGDLPKTGSNTGLLVVLGAGLLAIGGALVAARRQIWNRVAG